MKTKLFKNPLRHHSQETDWWPKCLTLGAAALLTTVSSAQTFQTVDDVQYGSFAQNTGLAATPDGTLFASGIGTSDVGYRGLIRTSIDNGNSWFLLDDFLYPGLQTTVYAGIVSDRAGTWYVAGTGYDDGTANGGANHWIVRRSSDHGVTWTIVDDFVPGGFLTQPNAIAVDAAGTVYVAGDVDYANAAVNYWTVRKGIGGTNFVPVESFATGTSFFTAQAILVHPTAGIFVAGEAPVVINKSGGTALEWTVRRSTNSGVTWSTVDTFAFTNKSNIYRAEAHGIAADSLGNLYIAGIAAAPNKPNGSGYWHWVVRKGIGGASSWSTVDDYQLSPTALMWPQGVATDSNGNVYVVGAGDGHWIVRAKSAGATGAWSTVDDFQSVSGATPIAVITGAMGNVIIGGSGNGSSGSVHWLVRKR